MHMSAQNGGNPRLDRIEKLIEQSERANKEAHSRFEREMAEGRARHDREMAEGRARHDREMAEIRAIARKTREDMRRWGALGVKETRRHRKKINDLDAISAKYRARTDLNLAEITYKLNGLMAMSTE